MRYIYLDNYRGFSNAFIPLKKVNFLVGENSTGKSSVLSIAQLLSTIRFWFDPSFNTDTVSLGAYDDIVSIASNDRSFFRVGVIDLREKQNFIILTFSNKNGRSNLSKVAYSVGAKVIKIRIAKQISVKIDDWTDNVSIFDSLNDLIEESPSGYKYLKSMGLAVKGLPLFFLLQEGKRFFEIDGEILIDKLFETGTNAEAVWMAPIRTKPRRTYDSVQLDFSPEGEHTPYLVRDLLHKKGLAKEFDKFLKEFGKDSGLFDSLNAKNYGHSRTSPFELDVNLFGKDLSVDSVGYGVSQSLPIVVECFARDKKSFFIIQQPEVHLHPKAQAALGDLFYKMAHKREQLFLIETHSDYIIDRFRTNFLKQNALSSQILFFERIDTGNIVTPIEILENGSLSPAQPESYRDFFVKEQLGLLSF